MMEDISSVRKTQHREGGELSLGGDYQGRELALGLPYL